FWTAAENDERMGEHADAPAEHHPLNPPAATCCEIDHEQKDDDREENSQVDIEAFDRRYALAGALEPFAIGGLICGRVGVHVFIPASGSEAKLLRLACVDDRKFATC